MSIKGTEQFDGRCHVRVISQLRIQRYFMFNTDETIPFKHLYSICNILFLVVFKGQEIVGKFAKDRQWA